MGGSGQPTGRDLAAGVALSEIPADGTPLAGHLEGEAVLLSRSGESVTAVGGSCTHYGGPLADGLVDGDTVRCPWHHACFSLRTGEALAAPALNPLPTWDVVVRDGRVTLGTKRVEPPLSARGRRATGPESVVIVGAGAAGSAAAEQLRREGYAGRITMVDPDEDAPYDRPNLSKDYLAGSAPEAWIPLRPAGFYAEHGIERVVERATSIDTASRTIELESGARLEYGAALLAPGATPRRLDVPGADAPHVHVLRSLADCRALIRSASSARSAVLLGAGFVGMEAAASLRARGVDVTVVAPEAVPFERALGAELGGLLRETHERNGVRFRLGHTAASIGARDVTLDDGSVIAADVVLIGIGVVPDTALAERAGLAVDRGILVDAQLRTSDAHVYAAGDVARWPDPHSGRPVRIEHWVVAQRQGQLAARNMLGAAEPFDDVPFFWTRHFDVAVAYVGHAENPGRVSVERDARSAAFRYFAHGRLAALATIDRDRLNLEAERELYVARSKEIHA